MKPRLFNALSIGIGVLAGSWAVPVAANDGLVVYVECTSPEGMKSQGSGVLVSSEGHVLTARHVMPDGANCQASIGNNTRSKRAIRPSFASRKIDGGFDALLMEFGRDATETFPFASLCPVTDDLKGRPIIAKGFHASSFGAPSSTDGILSSTAINFEGLIETTAMTVNGKSGGPVFLRGSDAIVGIIAGASFTPQGVVSTYSMLATDAVISDLPMLTISKECLAMDGGFTKPDPDWGVVEVKDKQSDLKPSTTGYATGPEVLQTISTRDPSDEIVLHKEIAMIGKDQTNICLHNVSGSPKRLRVSGQEIIASAGLPITCAAIHKSGGHVQFAKQKSDGAFHLVGNFTVKPDIFAGQGITFRWTGN